MKKTRLLLSALLALLAFNTYAADKLIIAATAVPHAEMLEFVKPSLAKEGIELQIEVFTDYVQPNMQVAGKKFDANFFQHKPYLDEFNKTKKTDLVVVAGIHVEPFGAYSKKIQTLTELKNGATVAIPNDPTNGGRSLLLMQKNNLIKLKPEAGLTATINDIIENPKKLQITELEAAMLPRVLHQFDFALINTNYALAANLNPMKDALFIEGIGSPYVNVLVARPDNAKSPALQKLVAALTSKEMREFILNKYKGAVVPAF